MPDKAFMGFMFLVRDQEVEGSNPFAPTTFSLRFGNFRWQLAFLFRQKTRVNEFRFSRCAFCTSLQSSKQFCFSDCNGVKEQVTTFCPSDQFRSRFARRRINRDRPSPTRTVNDFQVFPLLPVRPRLPI